MSEPVPPWVAAHATAQDRGLDGYLDPESGLFVMTAGYLFRRGNCCGSDCRHCPYRSETASLDGGQS